MKTGISRRSFLRVSKGTCAAAAVGSLVLATRPEAAVAKPPIVTFDRERRKKNEQLDPELVQLFIRKAHADLEAVKRFLEEEPGLVNANWDWGGGDFEAAIGGASHMGNRDIALYLLSKGARLNLFAAAMLGNLDVVRGALQSLPDLRHVPGPHGIPLIRHAETGGKDAAEVVKYIKSLG